LILRRYFFRLNFNTINWYQQGSALEVTLRL